MDELVNRAASSGSELDTDRVTGRELARGIPAVAAEVNNALPSLPASLYLRWGPCTAR